MTAVNQGFVLRAYNLDGTLAKEQSFSGLPIRIGRNALNDFQLDSKTVSNFHARIDYEHGQVRVYDLNSTNGVFTRIPNQRPAERVGEHGAEIAGPELQIILGSQLWLSLHPAARPISDRRAVTGSVLGNPAMLEAAPGPGLNVTRLYDAAVRPPAPANAAPSGSSASSDSALGHAAAPPGNPYAPPVWATPAPPPPGISQPPIHAMRSIPVGPPPAPGERPPAPGQHLPAPGEHPPAPGQHLPAPGEHPPAPGQHPPASPPAHDAPPLGGLQRAAAPPGPAGFPDQALNTMLSAGSTRSPAGAARFTPVESLPPPQQAPAAPVPSWPAPADRARQSAEAESAAASGSSSAGAPEAPPAPRNPLAERLPDGVRAPEFSSWQELPDLPHNLPDLPGAADAPPLPPLPGGAVDEDALQGFGAKEVGSAASQYWNQRAGVARETGYFDGMALSLDQLALAGLRELAASLAPGNELQTSGDIARFVTKLHDAIDVFCKSFIPLREGYSQFVSSMDLQRAALRRSRYRSQGYMRVEAANDPQAVASALLDWTDKSLDSHKAIEGIFADLMIHQVALLDGVMQGVRALLEELSPEQIEARVGEERLFGINRHKDLWKAYCERYSELAVEEQAFNHIFGRDFAEAYRDYQRRKAKGES